MLNRSMARRISWRHVFAAAALLLASAGSQACEIWWDEELARWRGTCDFYVSFKKRFQLKHEFIMSDRPRLQLKLPDLYIRKFKFYRIGTQVQIEADVANLGLAGAPPTELAVTLSVADPVTQRPHAVTPYVTQVPALAANSTVRVYIDTIFLPDNLQDWDLILIGVTDPPTAASPSRGAVFESDETNNLLQYTCRVFGPRPDTSVEACD